MASFFSPLSGQIYYPVMPLLVQNYHLTTALVNLSITTYMVLQGIAPSFMGTFSDASGRRPAYMLAFAIYTAANIGLALQDSFAALLVLRCLQSAGSSGTVAFGYGVIADVTTTGERGKFMGPMAAGVMVAPALGPVIGGLLAQFLGWRSVFWFLVIISGSYLVVYVVLVPETSRKIVGDGSVPPQEWWRMSLLQYWKARQQQQQQARRAVRESSNRQRKISFPNPLRSVAILAEKDGLVIITYVGLLMFANLVLMTSTPNIFPVLYGYNELQVGLCFLPLGISACIGAVLNGKILDFSYRRTARKLGVSIDRRRGDDLRNFPIEKARLQPVFFFLGLQLAAFLPYGWVLERRAPLAAPLILQFVMGLGIVASSNTLSTLLVDIFPDRPSTASAACNLVRCLLGAVGAAVVDYMLSGMGWGWCFFFVGMVMLVATGLLWVEMSYGMEWRRRRWERLEKRKQESST
ncbi:hypothetical protein T310_6260 [Rasamsonia emersonii CBS 393.64]|uniref:Major facilitator superfamily (MFS) profile domain-containing protein n=1 Tax=Rasamsonia emersonii (strain ATCC 16479 / CBS 393.64 / IMI 116815) TaxID=1408163 RepID=A0A0F4YQ54_RASE3|nr:hypothetical protein T310_6260 [Rasamsonia emersonii CBS 393.64]KKA19748.1 hypothetical protein T310_6260 [Rasamsonia emersonii CBS 393.64]